MGYKYSMGNFCHQVLKPLGSYMRVFTVISDPVTTYVKIILCTQNFVKMTDIEWLAKSFDKSIWLHGIQFLLPEHLPVSEEISFLFIDYILF